jgi:hypothetical protein
MIVNVNTSIDFRPILSPKCPKMIPPSGLARKPTPKTAYAASCPTKGFDLGKNSVGKISAAANP